MAVGYSLLTLCVTFDSIIMYSTFSCHTILQKSAFVFVVGSCVAINASDLELAYENSVKTT